MKIGYKTNNFFCCILLKIAVEYGYADGVGIVFAYSGIDITFSIWRYIFSWIVALFIFWFSIYQIKENYLWIINMIFMIFSYIPTMSLWGITAAGPDYILAALIFLLCMVMGCRMFQIAVHSSMSGLEYEKAASYNYLYRHKNIIKAFVIVAFIFSFIFNQIYADGRLWLSFEDSLSARLALREVVIPTLPRYMYMILGGCILPVLFSICLYMGKKAGILVCLASSFMLYTVNGMKTWLLLYLVILGLFVLYHITDRFVVVFRYILLGFSFLWGVGIIIYKITGAHLILAYLHRTQTLPAELHLYYFDFFKTHQFLYLRDSVGRHILQSPYKQPVSRLIGKIYYSSPTMNCTNGMLSDFYENFGYVGFIIYPILIFGCFHILFKMSKKIGEFIIVSMAFTLAVVLFDNTFFTWMITGGYFFAVILLRTINKIR